MLIYPLFRLTAPQDPGISFIVEGPEIASNPAIGVRLRNAAGTDFDLTTVTKRMIGAVMYVHARPPDGHALLTGLSSDGGIGSITVTVTGTTDSINAQVGYGEPSLEPVSAPTVPPAAAPRQAAAGSAPAPAGAKPEAKK